jgi:hypothetical protein
MYNISRVNFVVMTDFILRSLTSFASFPSAVDTKSYCLVSQTLECARISDQYVAQVADLTALKYEVCQGLGIGHLNLVIRFQ